MPLVFADEVRCVAEVDSSHVGIARRRNRVSITRQKKERDIRIHRRLELRVYGPLGPEIAHRLERLELDLRALDARLAALAQRIGDAPLLFSHPVYQYLIQRYELNARSVHWEPGEPPDETMFAELDAILGAHPARWMIWEGVPLPATVRALRARGVDSLVFDPGANTPAEGDFLTVMEDNARTLEGAFVRDDERVDE